jgi:diguanylate cyclase (GGDEF)-like protein
MKIPTPLAGSPHRLAVLRWAPVGLLLITSGLAVEASRYVVATGEARLRSAFLADAEETRHDIQLRLNSHFDVVRATTALLTANNEISGAEFRAFVMALRLRDQYPGLDGIGLGLRVPMRDLPSFQRASALDGTPLKVWPSGLRPDYYPVTFLEPMDQRSISTIGFDLTTDETVRAAMERSRDTGQPIVSVASAPALSATLGTTFLFLDPIYRRGGPVQTVEERRLALVGFAFSPFSAANLLNVVAAGSPSVAFEVHNSEASGATTLLYRSAAESGRDGFESAATVVVAGQPWLVVVRSIARKNVIVPAAAATLGAGLLVAFMLFAVTRAQVRAWETAARHEMALRQVALHDPLTGLPNRALLDDRLANAIAAAQRHSRRLAVLFVDVDRFKQINDAWGHASGDALLRSVAERLLGCVRNSDTVSRHGGDEFVILLMSIDQAQPVASRAQEIINALVVPHTVGHHTVKITVSIGVSVYPDDGHEAATLLQAADAALYQAKEHGRDRYEFFTAEMNARAVARQAVEASLRRALTRQELQLHYQPKVDFATGATTGVEALVRWRDPERGLIGPMEFVPIAEESGLIVPIGRWVLREACRQARAWYDAGAPVTVAVNVSSVELRANDFAEHVSKILDETRLEPRYLELELTESVLMQHATSAVRVLQALRARGVTIAVDDFGTGYSGVSYLRQFPIDVLKVDQSFVREITETPDGFPIVSAMISLGRSLGHRVIVEGVETPQQYAFLRAQQCGEGQGFFFSRPLPADQITTFLRAGVAFPVVTGNSVLVETIAVTADDE